MLLSLLLLQAPALAPTDFSQLLPGDPGEKTLHVGGRLMEDFGFYSGGELTEAALGTTFNDDAEVRRARIRVFGDFTKNISYKLEYDWAGGVASIKDGTIKFKVTDVDEVVVGHQFEPFGMDMFTSTRYSTFIERATLSDALAPGRNMGLTVWRNNDTWTFGGGVFRDADDQGKTSDEGWSVSGRAVYRPVYEDKGRKLLHFGVAASLRRPDGSQKFDTSPEANSLPNFVSTGVLTADQVTLVNLEAAFQEGPFHGMFEYSMADVTDNSGGEEPSLTGYSLQTGWFLTGENRGYTTGRAGWKRVKPRTLALYDGDEGNGAWEVALRYSNLDLTEASAVSSELSIVTAGLNWYLNNYSRVMLDVSQADLDQLDTTTIVALRFAIDF